MTDVERSPRGRVTGAMPSAERVRQELRHVPEPCGLLMREPLDICEMGLVEQVVCAGGHVEIVLVLTDASCVHFPGLQRYIGDVVGALPGVASVSVTASTTILWSPDRREPHDRPRHRRLWGSQVD